MFTVQNFHDFLITLQKLHIQKLFVLSIDAFSTRHDMSIGGFVQIAILSPIPCAAMNIPTFITFAVYGNRS